MILSGKVVFVTGAAQGFGRQIAIDCASDGATVIASDLDSCDETIGLVTALGGDGLSLSVDVTDYASCTRGVAAAMAKFGRVDALVNNAGLYGSLHLGPFEIIDGDEWDLCMKVNIKGAWHMARAVAPVMRKNGVGSIVNIASTTALMGQAMMAHYATSKAGLIGLSRVLASELGPDNIRVNAVCPGAMDTPGTRKVTGPHLAQMLESAPKARFKAVLEPDEVSGTIKFLVSDASRLITGQSIVVDGGVVTT